MDGYWVRQDGRQFWAGDLDALIRMVAEGRLRRGDEVYTGTGWERAGEFELLRNRFGADPFDAWADADQVDADAALRQYTRQEPAPAPPRPRVVPAPPPETAPSRPLVVLRRPEEGRPGEPPAAEAPRAERPVDARHPEPVGRPGRPEPRPEAPRVVRGAAPQVLPPDPDDDTDERTDPGPRVPTPPARGEVIDFPRSPPPLRLVDLPPPAPRAPRAPVPLLRPGRLAAYVGVGAIGVALYFGWVRWAATTDAGISTPPPTRPVVAPAEPPEAALERELRALLTGDARSVRGEGALADALLIDIQRMGVDVERVDAPVTRWTGRGADEPEACDIRVVLGSMGEVDRTLGGIALVTGRYIRTYRLQVGHIEVVVHTPEGDRATRLDPSRASEFFAARIGLEAMLAP